MSPLLFNLYIQYVINEALEDILEGVKVGGVLIPAIRFADDQAMVSHTVTCKRITSYYGCTAGYIREVQHENQYEED